MEGEKVCEDMNEVAWVIAEAVVDGLKVIAKEPRKAYIAKAEIPVLLDILEKLLRVRDGLCGKKG